MQKAFRRFINIFVAITLAAFMMSAISTSSFASNSKVKTSIIHMADSQKDDGASDHQNDGECDDGCCISHCFHCAGFAIPATQTYSVPSIGNIAVSSFYNQKAESGSSAPQLRPPRILA